MGSESCTSANEKKKLRAHTEVKGKHKECIVAAFIKFWKNLNEKRHPWFWVAFQEFLLHILIFIFWHLVKSLFVIKYKKHVSHVIYVFWLNRCAWLLKRKYLMKSLQSQTATYQQVGLFERSGQCDRCLWLNSAMLDCFFCIVFSSLPFATFGFASWQLEDMRRTRENERRKKTETWHQRTIGNYRFC